MVIESFASLTVVRPVPTITKSPLSEFNERTSSRSFEQAQVSVAPLHRINCPSEQVRFGPPEEGSSAQSALQPSPSVKFPSSHSSAPSRNAFPQISGQMFPHGGPQSTPPSPELRTPSLQ